MGEYRDPPFREPLSSSFVYAAWRIDPVRVGPIVRPSAVRRQRIEKIRGLARDLAQRADVEGVRVLETSFIPPLPAMPDYDVVMLVRARTGQCAAEVRGDAQLQGSEPATVFLASNAACFGDTETPATGVNLLLNHFQGPSDRSAAVTAWRQISRWYATKMGVDNSTLLCTEDSAPYVVINWVRLPGGVAAFLLGHLLRPSFYRYVRGLLKRHRLTPLPVFVRDVPLGSSDG